MYKINPHPELESESEVVEPELLRARGQWLAKLFWMGPELRTGLAAHVGRQTIGHRESFAGVGIRARSMCGLQHLRQRRPTTLSRGLPLRDLHGERGQMRPNPYGLNSRITRNRWQDSGRRPSAWRCFEIGFHRPKVSKTA